MVNYLTMIINTGVMAQEITTIMDHTSNLLPTGSSLINNQYKVCLLFYLLKENLSLSVSAGLMQLTDSWQHDWVMQLAGCSVKSNNVDFLNQICYFSIKQLPNFPHKAEWIPFQT